MDEKTEKLDLTQDVAEAETPARVSKLYVGGRARKLLGQIVCILTRKGSSCLTEEEKTVYENDLTERNLSPGGAAMELALSSFLQRISSETPAKIEGET